MSYNEYIRRLWVMRKPSFSVSGLVTLLKELPESTRNDYLNRALNSDDLDVVCETIDVFGRLDANLLLDRIHTLLRHKSPEVRTLAFDCIERYGSPKHEESILEALSHETDPQTRVVAVTALERIDTPSAIPALESIITSDSSISYDHIPIVWFAENALRAIRTREGIGGE